MTARDPVCGAEVDPLRARAVAMHGKRFVYFCSAAHRDEFVREPERFSAGAPVESAIPQATSQGKSTPVPKTLPARESSRRTVVPPTESLFATPEPAAAHTFRIDESAPEAGEPRLSPSRAKGVALVLGAVVVVAALLVWLTVLRR